MNQDTKDTVPLPDLSICGTDTGRWSASERQESNTPKPGAASELACPTNSRHPGDIVGGGSTNLTQPDAEGFVDCEDCGMFFKPSTAG